MQTLFPHRNHRPSARLRLYCLPYAGANAAYYKPWIASFPQEVEIVPIELPGRGVRFVDTLVNDMDILATQVADAIAADQDGAFSLFGHSMGSAIAFAVALKLEQRGHRPEQVVCSGRDAPHHITKRGVHILPQENIIQEMKRLGGTPLEVLENAELMDLVMPVVRNDYTLIETYNPDPARKITAPIHVLCGRDDPDASKDGLAAWQDLTRGDHSLQLFAGDHFYINPHRTQVIEAIAKLVRPPASVAA